MLIAKDDGGDIYDILDELGDGERVTETNSKGIPVHVMCILEGTRDKIRIIDDRTALALFEGDKELAEQLMEEKATLITMLPSHISNPIRQTQEGLREKIIKIIAEFAQSVDDCMLYGNKGELIQILSSWGGKTSRLDKLIMVISD